MTQADRIIDYLMRHTEGLTSLEALEKFGCFRLPARVSDLKERGFDIRRTMETRMNESGERKDV